MLKTAYSKNDCQELRRLFIKRAQEVCGNSKDNCLLLSGGMDSVTALYSLLEAGVTFKAYTFYFKDWESADLKSVQNLEKQIGFPIEYLPISNKYEDLIDDIKSSIKTSIKVFEKLREVKVETTLALSQIERIMPANSNVISGDGGDPAVGFNRVVGKSVYVHGVDSRYVKDLRIAKESSEMEEVFEKRHNYIRMFKGEVVDFLLNFTPEACNRRFPKSILYYAFFEEHNKYHSYRKPKSFHKAANEKAMFNLMAMERGYKNALEMFKAIHKEMGE